MRPGNTLPLFLALLLRALSVQTPNVFMYEDWYWPELGYNATGFEALVAKKGEADVPMKWNPESKAPEFLAFLFWNLQVLYSCSLNLVLPKAETIALTSSPECGATPRMMQMPKNFCPELPVCAGGADMTRDAWNAAQNRSRRLFTHFRRRMSVKDHLLRHFRADTLTVQGSMSLVYDAADLLTTLPSIALTCFSADKLLRDRAEIFRKQSKDLMEQIYYAFMVEYTTSPEPRHVIFHPDGGHCGGRHNRAQVLRTLLDGSLTRKSWTPSSSCLRAVEVGTREGMTARHLLHTLPCLHLLSVDKQLLPEARINLQIFGDRSNLWELTSEAAAKRLPPESLDLVFIDALHTYEAAHQDILSWAPKVMQGGIVAGHDYSHHFPGVIRAVNEFVASLGTAVLHLGVDHVWWVRI
ncbi:unnamed protein product [Symbiodinium necroappetens]|uniref:Methyltransferase domain-containing protein n=1 Tax=Symbiodinium necroappetens TaxID=1628268 RepID=A0A812SZK6_9DINO|nr:unnamed protein product [Symbiodinium necroappetens]